MKPDSTLGAGQRRVSAMASELRSSDRKRLSRYVRRKARAEVLRMLGLHDTGGVLLRVMAAIVYVGAVWWFFSSRDAQNEALLIVLAIAPLLLALPIAYVAKKFSVQREMLDRMAAALQKAEARKAPKAELVIDIISIAHGGVFGALPDSTLFAFVLNVRNKGGKPSAAISWRLTIDIDGEVFSTPPHHAEELTLSGEGGAHPVTFHRKDAIQNKTYSPIPEGGVASGFFFSPISRALYDKIEPGTPVTLSCEQIDGTVVETSYPMGAWPQKHNIALAAGIEFTLESKFPSAGGG